MTVSSKKLFIILLPAIIITSTILFFQIKKSAGISVNRTNLPLIDEQGVDIPVDNLDPIYGNQGAPITITEFFDFNSKESRATHQALVKFVQENPTKIRLIIKYFPNTGFFPDDNMRPHQAAYCALKQDIYKYYDITEGILKEKKNIKNEDVLTNLATTAKIDLAPWQTCLASVESKTRIESAISLAKSLELKKAPEIFINNRKVNYLDEVNLNDLLKEIIKEY